MFRLVVLLCLLLATFASSNRRNKPYKGKIIGGHDRDITVVPHQVSVQYQNKHKCGGSIIGLKHILTAAHCVEDKDHSLFSIRAGSNYHFKEGQEVKVVGVTMHPKYNTYTINYDAAVLVLGELLTTNEKVQIANLSNVEPRPGNMALLSGWGAFEEGKGLSNFLQSVFVPVVSRENCQRKYYRDIITDQMFCAGYLSGGQDSCIGDSGGPVLVKTRLAGIISWSNGCGEKNFPGVNTNIAKILSWITTQLGE